MVRIAVEGCCHGELNKIYSHLTGSGVELLLICGDFQAIRNKRDLQGLAVPTKYRQLGDFNEYYSGKKTAPVLTIFIGGNHESSSYLKELKFGGWVAPNIYYLGEYGSIWYRGLKISGISGIYNFRSFLMNYYKDEILPYTEKSLRSVYHVNPKNMMKMLLERNPADVVLSHDWPQGIELLGNSNALFRIKPHFKADSMKGHLGSPVNRILMERLQPRYWFLAHMHVRYSVKFQHKETSKLQEIINKDSIELDMDDDDSSKQSNPEAIEIDMESEEDEDEPKSRDTNNTPTPKSIGSQPTPPKVTEFLALDKCLPRRKFLEYIDIAPAYNHISASHPESLFYDRESTCINKVVETFISDNEKEWKLLNMRLLIGRLPEITPVYAKLVKLVSRELESRLGAEVENDVDLRIPENFEVLAPTLSQEEIKQDHKQALRYWPNNQTSQYCQTFGIPLDSTNTGST